MPTPTLHACAAGCRGRRAAVAVGVAALLAAACSEPIFAAPQLAMELHDGAVTVRVTGEPGLQVALVANRPWTGEQELFPGLVGLRCSAQVLPPDRAQGAGVQLAGVLQPEVTTATIAAERLRALPAPAVLQAVAVKSLAGGAVTMALSNAFVLDRERDGAEPRLSPWTATWAIERERHRILGCIAVPLLLWAGLRRLRRVPSPRWWLLGGIVVAVVVRARGDGVVAAEGGEAPPPLLVPVEQLDEVQVLERHYGPGVRALLDAALAARRDGEPISIVLGSQQATGRELLAAHLAQRLPGALVVTLPPAAIAPGLAIALEPAPAARAAAAALAATMLQPTAGEHAEFGTKEQLATSPAGTLWRLGPR